jgi:hypothetical protein
VDNLHLRLQVQSVEGEMGRTITAMPPWLIPIIYAAGSVGCSLVLPRFENAYLPSNEFGVSVSSAQAFLSAAASGMMALTGMMRRLRSALAGLMESTTIPARSEAAQRYIKHLDLAIDHSTLDAQDQTMARHEDRQGLGLSRKRAQI